MKNDDILIKLVDRTIEYFKDNLKLPLESEYEILDVDNISYLDITTLISLSHDMSGTIGLSVSNELAFKMIENFDFGDIPKSEIIELASENVAETLNITLGNILKELNIVKEGGSVNISTPYTMHNKVNITKKRTGIMYLCKLKSNREVVMLSYFI